MLDIAQDKEFQTMTNAGEVAVITGAASGIGCGLARVALSRGMKVVLADIDAHRLDTFAASLDGDVACFATDVASAASVGALADFAYDTFGQVDLLFNNAGVLIGGKSWEIPAERWEWLMRINVLGVVHGISAFVPRMISANRPAHVVNTASIGGLLASPLLAPYSASKFAVVSMTEALAVELQLEQASVTASVLCPGPVQTDIFRETETMTGEPEIVGAVAQMRDYTIQGGITPDELARRAFAGIDAGEFWLIPQPETVDDVFRERVNNLLNRRKPEPAAYNLG